MHIVTTEAIIIFIVAFILFINPKGIEAGVGVLSFNKLTHDFEKIQSHAIDGSLELSTLSGDATTQNQPFISESLQGTIIGGIIGFGSAIMTDIIKRWITRPKISISE
jgi:hypothetical protein